MDKQESPSNRSLALLLTFLLAADVTLAAGSFGWPMPVDAGVFHFAASQFLNGGAPYRAFTDINMPGIYWLHEAILGLAGAGDLAFRAFDLGAAALNASAMYLLCRPAGRLSGAIAAAFLILLHLGFGPEAAGQRDFLLLVPLLASALLTLWGAENANRRSMALFLAGGAMSFACLLKPTAAAAFILPLVILGETRWRDVASLASGASLIGFLALLQLHRTDSLEAFIAIMRENGPAYAQFDAKSPFALARTLTGWMIRLSGFILAAAFAWRSCGNPRGRAALMLILVGLVHVLAQSKGYYYHLYPLLAGIIALGAMSLPKTRPIVMTFSAALVGAFAVLRTAGLLAHGFPIPPTVAAAPQTSAATADMESALSHNFKSGTRVQLLDSDAGGFLAMARAGMRQATPDAYWFLLLGRPEIQARFLERLRAAKPEGVLVTNTEWPVGLTFDGFDRWTELKRFIDENYTEIEPGRPSWRLYKRR